LKASNFEGIFMKRWRLLHVARAVFVILAAPAAASEQAYPTRPIQVIVPFAGGSASDVVMRILLDRMAKSIGQPFIVDNGRRRQYRHQRGNEGDAGRLHTGDGLDRSDGRQQDALPRSRL
jgi:hypothetical protein